MRIASESAEVEDGETVDAKIGDAPATKGSTPAAGRENEWNFFCELLFSESGIAQMSTVSYVCATFVKCRMIWASENVFACMLSFIDLPLWGCLLRVVN